MLKHCRTHIRLSMQTTCRLQALEFSRRVTARFNQKELSVHLCFLFVFGFLGVLERTGFSGYMRSHAC